MLNPLRLSTRKRQALVALVLAGGLGATLGLSHLLAPLDGWSTAREAAGTVSAPVGEASAVTLHQVTGAPALNALFEQAFQERMESQPLRFSAPGVRAMTVDALVVDETAVNDHGELEVRVRVTLLMIDQPSNALRGSLSGSAAVTLGANVAPEVQQKMKERAIEALAASLHDDLAQFVVAARS